MTSDEPTPANIRTGKFLEVEEMASSLASRLSRLDEKVDLHSRSAAGLSQATETTRELIDSVRALADGAAKALDIVASVGGPEIVSRLVVVESQAEGIVKRLLSAETRAATQSAAMHKRLNLLVLIAGASAICALASTLLLLLRL